MMEFYRKYCGECYLTDTLKKGVDSMVVHVRAHGDRDSTDLGLKTVNPRF